MTHSIEQTRNRNPMWVYEQNYLLFIRLFEGICDGSEAELSIADAGERLKITLLEQSPYTQTLRCHHVLGGKNKWLADLRIVIRLYHDAQLAEVLHYQDSEKLQSQYAASNMECRHKDEKKQVNRLFWEWLNRWVARQRRAGDLLELST